MNIKLSSSPGHHWPLLPGLHGPARPSGTGESPPAAIDDALRCFEQGHTAEAFAALRILADQGDPAAARMALMLSQRGAALFGGSFVASPGDRERWRRCGEG